MQEGTGKGEDEGEAEEDITAGSLPVHSSTVFGE